ncbi:MAG: glucosyl-3-phosphoglycerate synthase [Actinomycetota bacterium]|nr:glucosyl-3-phosphoglycerate synthase [Actinomycetota bacterium]
MRRWFATRTYDAARRSATELAALKDDAGASVSVCLPALNEAATVGAICERIRDELIAAGIVDELVVVDSGSNDATQHAARAAGAAVVRAADVLAEVGPNPNGGKGESLWKSLAVTSGDIVVWLDSDTKNFTPSFITSLLEPLLEVPRVAFVKAFYERPLHGPGEVLSAGGARVTEIAIRPLINLFFPHLAGFVQPLSGEYAGRRAVLEELPFATNYAVDISLLLEVIDRVGLDRVAQADLGSRIHRNRDVPSLGRMSFDIVHALMTRLDDEGRVKLTETLPRELVQFQDSPDGPQPATYRVDPLVRPPMAEVRR